MSDTNALSIQPARWQLGDEGKLFAPLYSDVYASRRDAWVHKKVFGILEIVAD